MTAKHSSKLSALRRAAGYTQESFVGEFAREAALLDVDGAVSVRHLRRWERETPPPLPHPSQQVVLEAMFGVPISEMGFDVPSYRESTSARIGDDGEVKRRAFVAGSGTIATATVLPGRQGPRIGTGEAAALRARLTDLYTVDHRSGGACAQVRAARLEQQVTHALNNAVYTTRVGRDLQATLCEIACHRAWFGYDSGPSAEARTACLEALSAAQLVGDPLLQVRALNTFSLLSASAGRTWEAASAVEAAYGLANRFGAGATVRLVIALREAGAATRAGDFPSARRALSRAVSHQGRADADSDVPKWARFAGPAEVDYATAGYYAQAGQPARAVPFLRSAVKGLGGGYTRNTAWYRARLAQALLDTGEAEEACHEVMCLLDACAGVSSPRLRRRLHAFEQSVRRIDTRAAREMAERIRSTRPGGGT